jgi:futalosine hydrolase
MHVLVHFATHFEMMNFSEILKEKFQEKDSGIFWGNNLSIQLAVTGVGVPSTLFHLQNLLHRSKVDIIINAGIGGSFDPELKPGDVVKVDRDRFGDLGVEEKDGRFTDVFELELINNNEAPFTDGWIENDIRGFDFLPGVDAITVNKVHGHKDSIEKIKNKYPGISVESMEGAGAAYVASFFKKPFLQIRAISNYVEPRNRDAWEIELALKNLHSVLLDLVIALSELPK